MTQSDSKDIDFILNIYYSTRGDLKQINAVIESKLNINRTRKISIFENFLKSRLLTNSKALRMTNLEINSLEASYLSIYPGVENLEILDLRQNHIKDDGLRALAESPLLNNLRELDLRNNKITRKGLLYLIDSKNLNRLEKLDLRVNQIGGKWWLERFQKSGNFQNLIDLKVTSG